LQLLDLDDQRTSESSRRVPIDACTGRDIGRIAETDALAGAALDYELMARGDREIARRRA
jgi:hypothetical protein